MKLRRRWYGKAFITDEFKVNPILTLNIGLRYELRQHPRDPTGRNAMYDLASGKVVIPDGASKLISPLS